MLLAGFFAIGKIPVASAVSCAASDRSCIYETDCTASGGTKVDGECESGTVCCKNASSSSGSGVVLPTDTGLSKMTIKDILTNLLKWILQIVGVIAILGFTISGIMYLVSTGNEEMITTAKKYMLYCVIGIVVVLASFVIVQAIDSILKASMSI